MTGEGAVERWHATHLRKRGEYGGQGAEKGRQEMLPEIPNEVRRNWVGNPRRRDPRAERGVCSEQRRHVSTQPSCQLTLLPSSPSTPDKLSLSQQP